LPAAGTPTGLIIAGEKEAFHAGDSERASVYDFLPQSYCERRLVE